MLTVCVDLLVGGWGLLNFHNLKSSLNFRRYQFESAANIARFLAARPQRCQNHNLSSVINIALIQATSH